MKEQKVILKIFRALSEEEEEEEEGYITQGDSERSFNMKKNDDRGCEKALKYKKSSLSCVLLPPGGEESSCDSEEAESDTNMTDEERNLLNSWAENTEDGSGSFGTERELNVQNERQNAAKDCESQQVACQHLSDCRLSDLKQDGDDGREAPTEKHVQLPALFSGLRVLRKGVLGPEHDIVAQIRPPSQGSDMESLPEKEGDAKGSILEQISNFLNVEKRGIDKEEEGTEDDGESRETQTQEAASEPVKPVSSAEAAFDAFKAFFTPKPLKKDPGDKVDLEAVRKRIKAEREALRALFERSSVKSSEQKESSDHQVGTTSYGAQHTLN